MIWSLQYAQVSLSLQKKFRLSIFWKYDGKTVAIEPTDGKIVSPVNGSLEVIFPTYHAFAVRAKDGTGYLVHIGIDTVSMNGEGFKALKNKEN